MKFQWYVINLDDATVQGTNDVDMIQSLVTDDNFILLTAQHGRFFNGSDTEIDVEEMTSLPGDDDIDMDPDDDDESDDEDPADRENENPDEYVPDADSDEDADDENDDEPVEPIKSEIDDPENDKNW